jgi:hypothetical protein
MENLDPFLPAPDPSFALTVEERAQTFVAFDPDVVEQILRWVRPERRDFFRRTFFVDVEHQLKTDWGIIIPSDRPELVRLVASLARFDKDS